MEEEEASIENLEQKLDRTLKLCTLMIDSGKEYVKNQSVFATSLWELHSHFKENKVAQNALNKIITCFQVNFILPNIYFVSLKIKLLKCNCF